MLVVFPLISLSIGLLFFLKPALAIEIQRRLYEKRNWRIEPISMKKELRDTKIMGLFLILIGMPAIILTLIRII